MNKKIKKPELLAPAGDMERLKSAIRYGADAVYLGGTVFGMRAAPANFDKEELWVSVTHGLQGMRGLVPVVELTFQVELISGGCPLAVVPTAVNMMKTVVVMCIGEIIQGLIAGKNAVLGSTVQEHTQVDIAGEALQLGIQFQDTIHCNNHLSYIIKTN